MTCRHFWIAIAGFAIGLQAQTPVRKAPSNLKKPASKPIAQVATTTPFAALYRSLNDAYARNSYKELAAWFDKNSTPAFTVKSKQGIVFNRPKFIAGLKDQVKAISSVSEQKMTIIKTEIKGDTAVLTVSGRFVGVATFDGQPVLLSDISESIDTWQKTAAGWKMDKNVVTREDVQMQQKRKEPS